MKMKKLLPLYDRVRDIIESSRAGVARSVDTAQVASNWLIGREIVEDEQHGKAKAEYGRKLVVELSEKLRKEYGAGYSATNLKLFRQFYSSYPSLLSGTIGHTLRGQLPAPKEEVAGAEPEDTRELKELVKIGALVTEGATNRLRYRLIKSV